MTDDKIPLELTSIVGDFETIAEVKKVPTINGKERNEYWVIGSKMWCGVIDYLKNHNYTIVGVDKHKENPEPGKEVRLWIRER